MTTDADIGVGLIGFGLAGARLHAPVIAGVQGLFRADGDCNPLFDALAGMRV